MAKFTVNFTHSAGTFKSLAHMQYDLFCRKNRVVRSIIALGMFVVGVIYLERWWSYVLIAYGAFLATGKYNQANRTARKLSEAVETSKMGYPASKFIFEEDRLRVIALPSKEELDPLKYEEIKKIGQDKDYYYIFRDEYGGYVIPKAELGDREEEFVSFLKEKANRYIMSKYTPPIVRLIDKIRNK